MKTINKYSIPLEKNKIMEIVTKQSPAHRKQIDKNNQVFDLRNAIDFMCKKGEIVKSSFKGQVIFIQDDVTKIHNKYCPPLPYELKENEISGNYLIIKHENNEYSWYSHLEPHKIKVGVGQLINEGDVLGFSGQNGWCLDPNLHFMIIKSNSKDNDLSKGFESLIIQWK